MKIAVTGGCGFIGSNLVEALSDHEVIVVDNFSTGYLKNKTYLQAWATTRHAELNFLDIDIRENLTAYEDLMGAEVVFHIGALARIQPSFGRPAETLDVNSQGTVQVLELARRSGARVVYAGSSSFYFDPYANPYAYSKWIGEEHCKMYAKVYNVNVGIARFFNVYGPRMVENGENAAVLGIFMKQKKNGLPLTVTGDGNQLRDFTDVRDIISGLKSIAFSDKKWQADVFNLGRGHNYSINEVAKMFHPDKIKYIPARSGEARETLADINKSQEILGWNPTHNLPDFIKDFLETQ